MNLTTSRYTVEYARHLGVTIMSGECKMYKGFDLSDVFNLINNCVNAKIIDSYQGIEMRWKLSEMVEKKIMASLETKGVHAC